MVQIQKVTPNAKDYKVDINPNDVRLWKTRIVFPIFTAKFPIVRQDVCISFYISLVSSTINAWSQVRGSEWVSCHDGQQEVSRCHTRGESEDSVVCRWRSVKARRSTLALKPRVDVTRSPIQEYQWPLFQTNHWVVKTYFLHCFYKIKLIVKYWV